MNAGIEMSVMWRHFGVCLPQSTKFSHFSEKYSRQPHPTASVKTSGFLNGSSFAKKKKCIDKDTCTFQKPINY